MILYLALGLALLLAVGAAAAVLVLVLSGGMRLADLPATFWAAFIAATASLAGLALGKFAELGMEDQRQRREQREMRVALHAEIRTKLRRQRISFAKEHRARTFARLSEIRVQEQSAEPSGFISDGRAGSSAPVQTDRSPVSQVDTTNFVLEAVKSQIFRLPPDMVGLVVTYYNLDAMFNGAVRGTQDPDFEVIEPDRRARAWGNVYKLANEVDAAAEAALKVLGARTVKELRAEIAIKEIGATWAPYDDNEAAPDLRAPGGGESSISVAH